MAINDWQGEPVLGGTWTYGGSKPERVVIVACNYDREHAILLDDALHAGEPGDDLPAPRPMGPDGVLYHVRGTSCPDFNSIVEAKEWADSQPWGPVSWDNEEVR